LVLFESPNRLCDTLREIGATLGAERRICVAREITKLHEEFRSGTAAELVDHYAAGVRGEVVLVIAPPAGRPQADLDAVLRRFLAGETVSRAAALAADETGASRRTAYARALELSERGRRGRS
jgi:16S rRNA (cytidine1402-2'-O)-methyltransferase